MGGVKFKPINQIKMRLGVESNGKVQRFATQRCYDHMEKYVPGGEKGDLAKLVTIAYDYITFVSPYAHYQYIGKLYVDPVYGKGAFFNENYGFWSRKDVEKIKTNTKLNYHTSGTGSRWDKKMVSVEIQDICREIQDYIRSGKQ